MSRSDKTLRKVLRGTADANIGFAEICSLLRSLGFDERTRGSHHIYSREGVAEIINLQPKGSKAKSYQVAQARQVILDNRLAGDDDSDKDADEEGEE